MQKRLCGREQEFGMKVLPPFAPNTDVKDSEVAVRGSSEFDGWRVAIVSKVILEIGRQLGEGVDYYPTSPAFWLANGARVYIDQTSLEFACAEGLAGSFDGLLQEKASELVISEAAEKVAKQGFEEISFYKNNAGPVEENNFFTEVSYGSHHNYSCSVKKQKEIFYLLANFIPAALPFTGNGHIQRTKSGRFIYGLSQRAPKIGLGESGRIRSAQTTESRTLLNERDEPLMHCSTGLNRLHLISRDATRCELQTWLVDTMTHLVLRLAEENWQFPYCYRMAEPVEELHQINACFEQGLSHKVKCLGKGGGFLYMDLWDYNQIFLNYANQLSPLSEMENKALEEWERILELLKARALDKLVGELDWATKYFVISGKMSQSGFGLDDVNAYILSQEYHNISISPAKSLFALLDEEGFIRHLVSREAVEEAKFLAPATRARSRGKLVRLWQQYPEVRDQIQRISWEGAYLKRTGAEKAGSGDLIDLEAAAVYHGGEPDIWFGEFNDPFSPRSSTLEKFCENLNLPAV